MTRPTRSPQYPPMHPGALLREDVIPAMDMPISEIAQRLGISRQTLHDILAERARVTADMALRLGKFFGNNAQFWLNLQTRYDLETAERRMADELARIEPHSPPSAVDAPEATAAGS